MVKRNKSSRVLLILLALALLASCAAPVVDEPIAETSEEVTTTQPAPTTEPFVIAVEVDEADPFSFVLRAYAEFAQWNMEARHLHREEWPAAFAQWEAEQPLLQRFTMLHGMDIAWRIASNTSNFNMHMEYALHDIDGNGVDELLIRFVRRDGFYTLFAIYALQDGVAVQQLQDGGQNSFMDIFPNGTVIMTGGRQFDFWTSFYRFADGQLRLSTHVSSQQRLVENEEWYTAFYTGDWENRTPISEQEFQRIFAEYGVDLVLGVQAGASEMEFNWRPLFVPQ
ncbi:MAG: hypothetical protein FWB76_04315 [Oscillospiraceae bacterium]|nr:hypothetical protein [Oscillospiraceae bacterium]